MITLGYISVHQIFQLAAAAAQIGQLDSLHCSVLDSPNKWGPYLTRLMHIPSAWPVGAECIPPEKIIEFPWPLMGRKFLERVPGGKHLTLLLQDWFDKHTAGALLNSSSTIFVGSETCTMYSFIAAKKRGMKTVLDFHGIPAAFLESSLRRAQKDFGGEEVLQLNSPAMMERKKAELELADRILVCSDFHAKALEAEGVDRKRIYVIPLWINTTLWRPRTTPKKSSGEPLKVIYAGQVSVAKGVPYLIQAAQELKGKVHLTVIGKLEPGIKDRLQTLGAALTLKDYMPQAQLLEEYHQHDILVMPSLGESFGYVSMEAMASGLPVIVSEHCGAPVPDPTWRIPVFSSSAIVERLRYYIGHPDRLEADGQVASAFASQFTPQRYRDKAAALFREWLATDGTE